MLTLKGVLGALVKVATPVVIISFVGCSRSSRQPIAYNHKKHLDLGLECGQCHAGIAEYKAHAELPILAICLSCHGEDDNPKTQLIRTYASSGQEIPWVKVYRAPAHVYF